jgi:hypothetical protein
MSEHHRQTIALSPRSTVSRGEFGADAGNCGTIYTSRSPAQAAVVAGTSTRINRLHLLATQAVGNVVVTVVQLQFLWEFHNALDEP